VVALRWYLRYGLPYRDVADRGADVDHVSVLRRVQRFTPLLADSLGSSGTRRITAGSSTRPTSRSMESGATSTGRSTSTARSSTCSCRPAGTPWPPAVSSVGRCGCSKVTPAEVVTDTSPVYPAVLEELLPAAWRHVEQYENNPIEADHRQLKRRRRPMRSLQTGRTAQVVIAGQAFLQNLRRGHYDLPLDVPPADRLAAAFTQLARAI
jgi:hypothetical protein